MIEPVREFATSAIVYEPDRHAMINKPEKKDTSKTPKENEAISLGRSTIEFGVHYADNNPENFVQDVCKAFAYTGVFDGLKDNIPT